MRQAERRQQKTNRLNPIYDFIRTENKEMRLNELWDDEDKFKVKGVWNSRAYFLQDLKKFVPADIEIFMSQRGGTFAKMRKGK